MIEETQAVEGSRFTYALGGLVLWGADTPAKLSTPEIKRIAIANPNLAPYGKAAEQLIERLGLTEAIETKLVLGENVGQAFAFVRTGNAQLGFVSEAQIIGLGDGNTTASWHPPADLFDPIAQDAVLLTRAEDKPAALAFMTYLQTDDARDIIAQHGYDLP